MWQELAVALIVAGALLYLVSRFVSIRRRRRTAQTFVPLSSLRASAKAAPDDHPPSGGCH